MSDRSAWTPSPTNLITIFRLRRKRASWLFAEPGAYFVDFMIYLKEGAAIVWREWLTVQ